MARKSITEKKCPACLEIKPRSGFFEDVRGMLVAYCILCSSAKQKERLAVKVRAARAKADSLLTPEELATEEWRDVEGYEGLYQVSQLGRVQRLEGVRCTSPRVLRSQLVKGYPCISLRDGVSRKVRSIHSMVAIAFIGPYPEGMEVNHLDHNRANPRLDNLEYRTHKGNMEYASENDRLHSSKGVPRNKLQPQDVVRIKQMLSEGIAAPPIARQFQVHITTIQSIRTGRTWGHIQSAPPLEY